MLESAASIPLTESASLLCGNLASQVLPSGQTAFATISRTEVTVSVVDGRVGKGSASHMKVVGSDGSQVLQARWCPLLSKLVLVLATTRGFRVFEQDGATLLYDYSLPRESPDERALFCRGIGHAHLSNGRKHVVLVGRSDGAILSLRVSREYEMQDAYRAHDCPVSDIASNSQLIATGDDCGSVMVWAADTMERRGKFEDPNKAPCTALALGRSVVFAAYGDGRIRVLDVRGRASIEIAAHARYIYAIDYSPRDGLLASVSEDSFLHLWQLPRDGSAKEVALAFSQKQTDRLICGVRFANDGEALAISVFESPSIKTFKRTY